MAEQKIWSGRFEQSTDTLMEKFSVSLHFDRKLFDADIAVNKAWALALVDIDVYSKDQAEEVRATLDEIQQDFHAGELAWPDGVEDIHSANERWLTERLGDLGARIHTGRSRNDQVATDTRIYLREQNEFLQMSLAGLQKSLYTLAQDHVETVLPGQTHLRQAQPISFAHYLLAFLIQLQRDKERLQEHYKRVNIMPLGAGAIAGAAFAIDREKLAKELSFAKPTLNSYDATGDRDVILELEYHCAQIMVHLSRIAEDLIIWSAEGYRFFEIDDRYATGSSMMPQKKNPDSLELIRGKAARVIGAQVAGLTMMKGTPTAYVRDLQEDKEPVFDALEQTIMSVQIMDGVFSTLKINAEKMLQALDPALYATDLADYLVKKGMPFRQAHSVVGSIVGDMDRAGKTLAEATLDEMRKHSELFNEDVFELFDPLAALEKRNLFGGTGPQSVKKQLEIVKNYL